MCLCRKQHSLWVQGDVHRSKQKLVQQRLSRRQQLRQQCEQQQLHSPDSEGGKLEAMSRLLSSMDDLSINTTLYKSYSLDEVRGGTLCHLYCYSLRMRIVVFKTINRQLILFCLFLCVHTLLHVCVCRVTAGTAVSLRETG